MQGVHGNRNDGRPEVRRWTYADLHAHRKMRSLARSALQRAGTDAEVYCVLVGELATSARLELRSAAHLTTGGAMHAVADHSGVRVQLMLDEGGNG